MSWYVALRKFYADDFINYVGGGSFVVTRS